jgi:hypothetical protein
MIRRPFEQWLFEDVEIAFNIERIKNMPILMEWLDVPKNTVLSPEIDKLRLLLADNVETWNESDLEMIFLAQFFWQFEFNNAPAYRVFMQRNLFTEENLGENHKAKWFIATGKQTPKKPFFFLQEYKPEKNSGNDPLGQLLIAMVDAQILNEDIKKPLFGCYMIGRFWFFVVLIEKSYSVSKSYDATQTDDLSEIVVILERVKIHIHKELGLPAPTKN